MAVYPRFLHDPIRSFFLFGLRGVGKSTLIHTHYQNVLWIELLRPDRHRYSYFNRMFKSGQKRDMAKTFNVNLGIFLRLNL